MKETKVSVIMSVWNGERFLLQAIESILSQSYQKFEFIIINDGSTDKSEDIILSIKDPRIRYLKNESNIGLAASLNLGIEVARGEFIARMDDDDLSCTERLQKQVEFLDRNYAVGVVGSLARYISEENELLTISKLPKNNDTIKEMLPFFWFHHGSVMMRKSKLLEVGGYDHWCKKIEDLLLWNKMAKITEFHVLQEPLYSWRLTVKGATNTPMTKEMKLLFNKIRNAADLQDVLHEIRSFDLKAENSQKNNYDHSLRRYQYYKQVLNYALDGRKYTICIKYFCLLTYRHFRVKDLILTPLKIVKKIYYDNSTVKWRDR